MGGAWKQTASVRYDTDANPKRWTRVLAVSCTTKRLSAAVQRQARNDLTRSGLRRSS